MQPPTNEAETYLLRSIEWTTFLESTYDVALEQSTVILRYFLGTNLIVVLFLNTNIFLGAGRVQAAHSLLALLPAELTSIAEPEEVATEYLHYRQFFVIWETIARVVDCQAEEGTLVAHGASREVRAAWLTEYRVRTLLSLFVSGTSDDTGVYRI
jgi:nuclear pore complex protein Nup107